MALRKSSVLTGLVALGFSCWVTALGLGDLTLHSALDEPFNGEIELINVGEIDENQILVGLASKADFDRAGVTREAYLINLKFKADLSDAKHPIIKVTSKESIKEPYLDFVTQLEWPSGRLLREYTLFLDLPVFNPQKTAAPTEAAVSSSAPQQATANAKSSSRQAISRSTSPSQAASASGSASYRVKAGDTLWQVAARAELGETTVQQRMVAIQGANPRAFVNGNANLLKKGAVLRIPDQASVELISQGDAKLRAADQSRAWNEQHKQRAARELIGDVPSAVQGNASSSKDGQLRLSTPTQASTSNSQGIGRTSGSAGDSTGSEVLQNELGIAQEELERSKRENLELKAKLAGLEAQLDTAAKLIELESDELKAVQIGVSADQEGVQAASQAGAASTESASPKPVPVDALATVDKKPLEDGSGIATEDAAKGPLSGFFAFLEANIIPLVGLLVVFLGVLFLVAKSKKEDQPESIEPFLGADVDVEEAAVERAIEADDTVEEESLGVEPALQETEIQAEAQVEVVEEVDPIGEADIYSSLGNYTEAEKVIETALETSPNDSKLHLKRLDLFAAQQDAAGFDAYYPTLLALGDADATATADRLRANIEEVIVESDEAPRELTIEEQVAAELGIDGLDLDLSAKAETELEPSVESQLEDDSDLLGADLEAELDSSFVEIETETETGEEALDLSDVELDLSEIELDLKASPTTAESSSEDSDQELEDELFGDISLPDELDDLSAGGVSDELDSAIDLELPDELADIAGDEINLQDSTLEGSDDEGLELSLDSFDFDADDDLDLELGTDESNTQLELAQAYIDMGDESGAKDILSDVLSSGSDEQKEQANELMAKLT